MLVLVGRFNRSTRALLAPSTGLLRHPSKRGFRVSFACCWFSTHSSRRQCRERTREGMAPGPAFLANEFDVLFEVTDPASLSPVDRPKPHSFTPESSRHPYSSPAQTRPPSALTPPHVAIQRRSPRRRRSRRFASSWARSSRATARTTGSCSSPCSSAPRSSCTDTTSRLASGEARGAWQRPGAFDER